MSLRLRLTIFIAAAVAVAVGLVAGFSYTSTADEARKEVDAFLRELAAVGERFPSAGGDIPGWPDEVAILPPERGPFRGFARSDTAIQIIDPDGELTSITGDVALPVDPPALDAARSGDSLLEDVTIDGTHYRMITAPGPDGVVLQAARDVTESDRFLSSLGLRLWLIGAAGVVLAAFGAWFVAQRALVPVARLTDAAETVAATGELSSRIAASGTDELGRLATSFNAMLEALADSRRRQRQLVNDAGHELRTPLTSLRTNLEVLERNRAMDEGQRAELMADIAFEIDQLSTLVSEVVDLAGEAGADLPPPEISDLEEIARDAADRAIRRTGREITVTGAGGTAVVRADRIARALGNLLDNAAKWSDPDTEVEVRLDDRRIEVLDRGPGIPEADLGRIFDRFFRTDTARTMPGSGLGLAIVKMIVDEHGGAVWARNRADGGAGVGFEVPPPD